MLSLGSWTTFRFIDFSRLNVLAFITGPCNLLPVQLLRLADVCRAAVSLRTQTFSSLLYEQVQDICCWCCSVLSSCFTCCFRMILILDWARGSLTFFLLLSAFLALVFSCVFSAESQRWGLLHVVCLCVCNKTLVLMLECLVLFSHSWCSRCSDLLMSNCRKLN